MKVFERPDNVQKDSYKAFSPSEALPGFSPLPSQIGKLMYKHGKLNIAIPNHLDMIPQRDQLLQSLQCKEIQDKLFYEKRLAGKNTSRIFGTRPQFGSQHGDPSGLASNWMHPTNSKMLTKTSNFYPNMRTRLGQPN